MAPTATHSEAALSALAACNLKELHLKRADGSRILDTLHSTCRAAGLVPHGTPDATPKERYLAVFDAALTGGLGCWILDYVELVCADRHLTSNDPLEAYLLDGGFVKTWAQASLQRAENAASSALQSESAFLAFQSGPLQRQLSEVRVLTSVLRALDRIRAVAAGGSALAAAAAAGASTSAAAGGAAAGAQAQDRLSVRSELRAAVLLEQAFQVMEWAARQGLGGAGRSAGRFGSLAEWSRAVAGRRSRAAPRPLFLDSLLQSLSLSGAYPSSSVTHWLSTLLLHVRDPEPPAWGAKLALLAYFLQDAGLLDGPAGHTQQGSAAGAAGAAGSSGGRVEAALEDLRRTFRLSAGDVGLWQCHYLLDCAAPDAPGGEDPYLSRACALLPACASPATPFAFIEAVLALGRPDVALAVDRGQAPVGAEASGAATGSGSGSGSGSGRCVRPYRSLPQALTLLEVRLRCGLLTEAFMLIRQHAADLAASAASVAAAGTDAAAAASAAAAAAQDSAEHTRVLMRRLAEWAAAADAAAAAAEKDAAEAGSGMEAEGAGGAEAGRSRAAGGVGAGAGGGAAGRGAGGWLNRLTELPLNATEEAVLVGWLCEESEAGRPPGDLLPLFFLQRGRVSEAAAAWHRWDARQAALASASGTRRSPLLAELVSSALDAAHGGLPGPLANVAVPPLPGQGPAPGSCLLDAGGVLAPSQGAVAILAGFTIQSSHDQPLASLAFHGAQPPPLLTRAVPLPPPPPYPAAAAAAATATAEPVAARSAAAAQPPARPAPPSAVSLEAPPAGLLQLPPPPPQQQQSFGAAMPLVLPNAAPFRAPPDTPAGLGAFGVMGGGVGGVGGGGADRLLFSVGAGAAAAAAPGGVGEAAGGPRTNKRSKPNDWLLG